MLIYSFSAVYPTAKIAEKVFTQPRPGTELGVTGGVMFRDSDGFARSTKAAQPYLIELATIPFLFTATKAAYDEAVEE